MGEIVNLRQARKRKRRRRKEAAAAQNRLAFARSKAERLLADSERAKLDRDIEAHRIPPSERPGAQIVKRSLAIAGHRTSVSLEDAFWRRLHRLAAERRQSVNALAAQIDAARGEANLSSAIRVYVLEAENARRNHLDQKPGKPTGRVQ